MRPEACGRVPTHPTGRGWVHRGAASSALAALALTALTLAACDGPPSENAVRVVTPFDGPVLEALEAGFEAAHPDLDVRFDTRDDAAVLADLDGAGPEADVWWGADWHAMAAAAAADRLSPVHPAWADTTADAARDPGGRWWGVAASPVVLTFHTESVSRARAPRDWIDLFHPRWRDEVVLPAAEGPVMRALAEAAVLHELRRTGSETAGVDFLMHLDAAASGYADDEREQVRRLQAGEDFFTLLPAHRAAVLEADGSGLASRMMETGTARLLRGVAQFSDPAEPARDDRAARFVDWVGSPEALRAVVEHTGWGPAVPGAGVDPDAGWPTIGSGFPVWTFSADTLTDRASPWYERWQREVRGRGRERF